MPWSYFLVLPRKMDTWIFLHQYLRSACMPLGIQIPEKNKQIFVIWFIQTQVCSRTANSYEYPNQDYSTNLKSHGHAFVHTDVLILRNQQRLYTCEILDLLSPDPTAWKNVSTCSHQACGTSHVNYFVKTSLIIMFLLNNFQCPGGRVCGLLYSLHA